MFDGGDVFVVIVSYSPTSGRMRYAPTLVRLIFGICWVGGWIRFRSFEGVCDTPLHLFDYCRGQIQLIIIPVRLLSGWDGGRTYLVDFNGMMNVQMLWGRKVYCNVWLWMGTGSMASQS